MERDAFNVSAAASNSRQNNAANVASLDAIEVRLLPDVIEAPLLPRPAGALARRLETGFHRVEPKPGALVSITSEDAADRVRIVRLSVECEDPRWRSRWARWVLARRQAPPELLGGDALSAQDVLSDDETTLTLLVLPGERREATLEIVAELDGATPAGDYPVTIVATDVDAAAGENGVPAVPAVRAYGTVALRHPPAALLNALPSLYREAMQIGDDAGLGYQDPPFFERFLRGFEDATLPMRSVLDSMDRLLSAGGAPPDFLPWLATWVSLVLDENWPELKRRRLIREAVELFRWRGTRRGLSRYLQIYAGAVPQIDDQPFAGMRLGEQTRLGDAHTLLGNVPDHTFVVTLAVPDPAKIKEQIVRDIIESEKPAHTAYELRIVRMSNIAGTR